MSILLALLGVHAGAGALAAESVSQDSLASTMRTMIREAPGEVVVAAIGSDAARVVEREARSDGLTVELSIASPAGDRVAELARVRRQAGVDCLLVVQESGSRRFRLELQCEAGSQAGTEPPAAAEDLAPFSFSKVIFRLDPGQPVGTGWVMRTEQPLHWGQDLTASSGSTDVRILELLRSADLPARGAEDLLFGQDRSSEATLVLGGEVRDVEVSVDGPLLQKTNHLSLVVEWQVFDRRSGEVTTRLPILGTAQADVLAASLLDQAVMDSARSLSRDHRFTSALSARVVQPQAVTFDGVVEVPACTAPARTMPADLAAALGAVLAVSAGARTGAAVMVSEQGWLLTAAHVVDGADSVLVSISEGGPKLPAEVVRIQPTADVALLRLPGSGYACLPIGQDAPVGTVVYAAGAPIGDALGISVSQGIVSGQRRWEEAALIQTDASLSPGHSGGPLIGPDGSALGVISFKVVAAGVEGMGFGVPTAAALDALQVQLSE